MRSRFATWMYEVFSGSHREIATWLIAAVAGVIASRIIYVTLSARFSLDPNVFMAVIWVVVIFVLAAAVAMTAFYIVDEWFVDAYCDFYDRRLALQQKHTEAERQLVTLGVSLSKDRSDLFRSITESVEQIDASIAVLDRASPGSPFAAISKQHKLYVPQIERFLYLAEWLDRQASQLANRATSLHAKDTTVVVQNRVTTITQSIERTRDFLHESEASLLAVIGQQDSQHLLRWFEEYSGRLSDHYQFVTDVAIEAERIRDERQV